VEKDDARVKFSALLRVAREIVMPYKHQAHCYRTIGGVQYANQCDVLDEEHFKLVEKAKRLVTIQPPPSPRFFPTGFLS